MSLILATGTNLGDKKLNLQAAQTELSRYFNLVASSRIYQSDAIEYLNQPNFFNQVLEFSLPKLSPENVIKLILDIEVQLGRNRNQDSKVSKGPRVIDIDIIFWRTDIINLDNLTIPHPQWNKRSFVLYPLMELPFFKIVKKSYTIPTRLNNSANPI